jgi:hypothetical protein
MGHRAQERAYRPKEAWGSHPPPRHQLYAGAAMNQRYKEASFETRKLGPRTVRQQLLLETVVAAHTIPRNLTQPSRRSTDPSRQRHRVGGGGPTVLCEGPLPCRVMTPAFRVLIVVRQRRSSVGLSKQLAPPAVPQSTIRPDDENVQPIGRPGNRIGRRFQHSAERLPAAPGRPVPPAMP